MSIVVSPGLKDELKMEISWLSMHGAVRSVYSNSGIAREFCSSINPLAAEYFIPFRGTEIIVYKSSPGIDFFNVYWLAQTFFGTHASQDEN